MGPINILLSIHFYRGLSGLQRGIFVGRLQDRSWLGRRWRDGPLSVGVRLEEIEAKKKYPHLTVRP